MITESIRRGFLFGILLSGCAGDEDARDPGSLGVLLEAEDTIAEGIEAGDDLEAIRDGWTVGFDKYLAALGGIDVHLASDTSVGAEATQVFVVDLTAIPSAGLALWSLPDLRAGRWEFNFAIPGAADGATRHESASQADFEQMQANDWTYLIQGTLAKADGRSCPPASLAMPAPGASSAGTNAGGDACYENPSITFTIGASAETLYGPCEIDGVPGFSVPSGGTQTVAITIHGDHLFFNGFPASETSVTRLAQWLADCDLDLDGNVTRTELEIVAPPELPEFDGRFALGGSPITPVDSVWTYVVAQLKTQGHFQGEGECPLDGVPQLD